MYPATVRRSRALVAVTVRDHGDQSPEAHTARLDHAVLMAAADLASARTKHGPFTTDQIQLILTALHGEHQEADAA